MKNDPFAGLSGLDQKLFATPSPASAARKKGRARNEEERPSGRPDARHSVPRSRASKGETSGLWVRRPQERPTERRPYDFFRDQVLWLNRTKVEMQEKYGRRVTANAMVQLALDLFIRDHKRSKERSQLVTHLILGQQTTERPNLDSKEAPGQPTSERPSGGS